MPIQNAIAVAALCQCHQTNMMHVYFLHDATRSHIGRGTTKLCRALVLPLDI